MIVHTMCVWLAFVCLHMDSNASYGRFKLFHMDDTRVTGLGASECKCKQLFVCISNYRAVRANIFFLCVCRFSPRRILMSEYFAVYDHMCIRYFEKICHHGNVIVLFFSSSPLCSGCCFVENS